MAKTYTFEVAMTCEGCVNAVKRVLGKVEDKVDNFNVDLPNKTVAVTSSAMTKDEIQDVLKKTGNDVKFLSEK